MREIDEEVRGGRRVSYGELDGGGLRRDALRFATVERRRKIRVLGAEKRRRGWGINRGKLGIVSRKKRDWIDPF